MLQVTFKSKDIETFTTQINNRINGNPEENSRTSLYYDMNEFNNLETTETIFNFQMHLNISSLQQHFEELDDILNISKTKFNAIDIAESCLKKVTLRLLNISLQNYKVEDTPAESEKGGSLLCISSDLNYKN